MDDELLNDELLWMINGLRILSGILPDVVVGTEVGRKQ